MKFSVCIVPVEKEEAEKLREICVRTFSETYEHLNTPENFKKYIETNFNHHQLTKELENSDSFTYFLYLDEQVIGYVKLNMDSAQTEKVKGNGLEVERIYVLKEFHGRQFGKKLLEHALKKADELAKEFIWLGVWEKNEKAISFYEKNEFKKFDTHIFVLGDDSQTDYLYKRML